MRRKAVEVAQARGEVPGGRRSPFHRRYAASLDRSAYSKAVSQEGILKEPIIAAFAADKSPVPSELYGTTRQPTRVL